MQSINSETPEAYAVSSKVADTVISDAIKLLQRRIFNGNKRITSLSDAKDYVYLKLAECRREKLCAILMNTQHQPLEFIEFTEGTIDAAVIYKRTIVEECLNHNAGAIILVHNHPSGDVTPSKQDKKFTQDVKEACGLFDIRVLDHLIVGSVGVLSFEERGLM